MCLTFERRCLCTCDMLASCTTVGRRRFPRHVAYISGGLNSSSIFPGCTPRVRTVAEVKAISEAVSTTTEREAASAEFVGPFAYRLQCVGQGRQQSARNMGDHNRASDDDSNSQEGFCDNGDVGSGEKLLALLQKWDVRQRVLIVTRIDGGFMMAELLGVRR